MDLQLQAATEAVQAAVTELGTVTQLKTDLAAAQAQVTALTADKAAADTAIATAQASIDALTAQLKAATAPPTV